MKALKDLPQKIFPKAPALVKLIGPSFIILGVGLGSGELILWPYMTSNFGLGIIWAAVVGITFQFFINMEIERYTLVTGEGIFTGFKRRYGKFAPVWFIFTTFVPWMWPGIIAASATVFAQALGIPYSGMIGIVLLIAQGILYSLGKIIYQTQETVQKLIILVGVPFVFVLTLYFASVNDWLVLGQGLVGKGEGFWFLPKALPFATFLGALAYAGAGGNLNLAQSMYVKEKGYGMGNYSGRITNILKGKKEKVRLTGFSFAHTKENLGNFNTWWKKINIEHGLVFWLTGAITMILLSLLAYSLVYGYQGVETGINFVLLEAQVIAQQTSQIIGTLFLVMVGIMLFGTQFSVFGSNARIMSENLVLTSPKKFKIQNLSKYFFVFLWFQILSGVAIFALGFTEPLALVVTGAVLNAMSMFIYSGLLLYMNSKDLPENTRPKLWRKLVVFAAFAFYGGFSLYVIYQNLPL